MTRRQKIALLPDRKRLHMQDGPIDLVIGADGPAEVVTAAYAAAAAAFGDVLDGLCRELEGLKTAVLPEMPCLLRGPIAARMHAAVLPHAAQGFITPMAAVAGAVAEHILAVIVAEEGLERAYVNNGGDIALHLSPAARFVIGMIDRPDRPGLFGSVRLDAADGIGGIATSGRHGRSFSLGIADAVTVLAPRAADADAAATIIANAVDLPRHPAVCRIPAYRLKPDSDLGARLVTAGVGPLDRIDIETALDTGAAEATRLIDQGLIHAAALHLQGTTRILGGIKPLRTGAAIHHRELIDG